MSKTSFKNAIDAKRLQLSVVAKNSKGEVLTYSVSSKDGKFKRVLPNAIGGEKTADADAKSKDKKPKSVKASKK